MLLVAKELMHMPHRCARGAFEIKRAERNTLSLRALRLERFFFGESRSAVFAEWSFAHDLSKHEVARHLLSHDLVPIRTSDGRRLRKRLPHLAEELRRVEVGILSSAEMAESVGSRDERGTALAVRSAMDRSEERILKLGHKAPPDLPKV